jgi:hypothetical protein
VSGQSTSDKSGVARQWGETVAGTCLTYGGDVAKLQKALGHPRTKRRLYDLFDKLAQEQDDIAALTEGGPRFSIMLGEFETMSGLTMALDAAGVKYEGGAETRSLITPHIELTKGKKIAHSYVLTPNHVSDKKSMQGRELCTLARERGFKPIAPEYMLLLALTCARQLQVGEECSLRVGEYLKGSCAPPKKGEGRVRELAVIHHYNGIYLWQSGDCGGWYCKDSPHLFGRN